MHALFGIKCCVIKSNMHGDPRQPGHVHCIYTYIPCRTRAFARMKRMICLLTWSHSLANIYIMAVAGYRTKKNFLNRPETAQKWFAIFAVTAVLWLVWQDISVLKAAPYERCLWMQWIEEAMALPSGDFPGSSGAVWSSIEWVSYMVLSIALWGKWDAWKSSKM